MSGSIGGAAYGATLVAGVGLKVWSNFSEACRLLTVETETEPRAETRALYDARYALYKSLYPVLKQGFAALTSTT